MLMRFFCLKCTTLFRENRRALAAHQQNENDAASRSVVSEFVRLAILMKNLLVSQDMSVKPISKTMRPWEDDAKVRLFLHQTMPCPIFFHFRSKKTHFLPFLSFYSPIWWRKSANGEIVTMVFRRLLQKYEEKELSLSEMKILSKNTL